MRKQLFSTVAIILLTGFLVHVNSGVALAYGRDIGATANQVLSELSDLLKHPPQALLIVAYVAGGLCLTVGFRVYQFIVMLPGILIGGLLGYVFGTCGFENQFAGVFICLIGAGAGGSIAWSLHQLAIWLVGALVGGVATFSIVKFVFETDPHGLVVLICAFICGSLLLALAKAFIVLKTSLIGALLFAFGARELDNIVLILGLAVIGIAVQYGVARLLGENLAIPGFSNAADEREPHNDESKHEQIGGGQPQGEPAEPVVGLSAIDESGADLVKAWNMSLFQNGSHVGTYQLAPGTYLLGRDKGLHFQLDDPAASRRHMEIEVCPHGTVQLRDLGSANGTWRLGREQVDEDSPGNGDWYQIGVMQIAFATGGA